MEVSSLKTFRNQNNRGNIMYFSEQLLKRVSPRGKTADAIWTGNEPETQWRGFGSAPSHGAELLVSTFFLGGGRREGCEEMHPAQIKECPALNNRRK